MDIIGLERIPWRGWRHPKFSIWLVTSGVGFIKHQFLRDPLTATDAWLWCCLSSCRRALRQFWQRQFHCGMPPPAEIPRIHTFTVSILVHVCCDLGASFDYFEVWAFPHSKLQLHSSTEHYNFAAKLNGVQARQELVLLGNVDTTRIALGIVSCRADELPLPSCQFGYSWGRMLAAPRGRPQQARTNKHLPHREESQNA